MFNPQECPPMEQLHQLALGKLPNPPASNVERHVLNCEPCAEATLNLAANETLIEAMRGAAGKAKMVGPDHSLTGVGGDSALVTELVSQLIQKLRDLPTRDGSGADAATVLSGEAGSEAMFTNDWSSSFSPAESADEIGRMSNFRILQLLGLGGMGAVFLAEDMHLQRRVALKVMRPEFAARPGATERFLREARSVAAVHNEHVVTIHQVGEATVPGKQYSVPFLAQELLQGESLDVRLKREGQLPISEALSIAKQIAEGLAAAHERGLIHRDIKPANVWLEIRSVEGSFRVKLLDFGLARPVNDTADLTESGMILGTPAYMAPEQARGEMVDARADLFSMGCVLYLILTGQAAFSGKDVMATLMALAMHEPPAPQIVRTEVPKELSDLVMRLLEKNRDERPATATEVSHRLGIIASQHSSLREARRLSDKPDQSGIADLLPDPAAHLYRSKVWAGKGVGLTFAALSLMVLLGLIVLKIKTKDGKETEVTINVRGDVESIATTVREGDHSVSFSNDAMGGTSPELTTLTVLDPARIPESECFDWQPKELVAVIGEHQFRHWGRVMQVRFHPSGTFFITCPDQGMASLWMTNTLERREDAFVDDIAQSISFDGFEFSHDGKWMSSANQIYLVDVTNPDRPQIRLAQTLFSDDHGIGRGDVAIHANRWLITASEAPGKLMLWNIAVDPGRHVKTIPFNTNAGIRGLSLASDGRQLVASNWDGTVHVWEIDWANPEGPEFTLLDHQLPGVIAVLSPQGAVMAVGGDGNEKIELWDTSQPAFKRLNQIPGGREFAFSPDGKHLAVASGLGIQLYAQEESAWVSQRLLSEGMAAVLSLAWSPDQKTLVAGDQFGGVHIWDTSSNPPVKRNTTRPASNVVQVAISPDGHSLIASGADLMTTSWNLNGAAPVRLDWHSYGEWQVSSFSHDSQLAQFCGRAWNLKTIPPSEISEPISELSRFSPTEPSLISYSGNRLFQRDWNLTKRGRLVTTNERDLWISKVSTLSNDALFTLQFGARRFATSYDDHTVCIWNLENSETPLYELKHELSLPHTTVRSTLTLSPDGNVLLAFSQQGSIVWDLEESPPRKYRLQLETGFKNAFFTADNKLLIVADGNGLGIYDWTANRELRRLKYPGMIRQVIPHPDAKHVLTVNGNGTVYILRMPELAK